MASEHLVTCKLIKFKDTKSIQSVLEGDNKNLNQYCQYVAALYSMKNGKVEQEIGESTVVVWGDSPTVQEEYSMPNDIDVEKVLDKPLGAFLVLDESATPPTIPASSIVQKTPTVAASPPAKAQASVMVITTQLTAERKQGVPSDESKAQVQSPNKSIVDASTLSEYHMALLLLFEIVPITMQAKNDLTKFTAASIRCKSSQTRFGTPTSIENLGEILMKLPAHAEKCDQIPIGKMEHLRNSKSLLKSDDDGVESYVQYVKALCTAKYGMVTSAKALCNNPYDEKNGRPVPSHIGFKDIGRLQFDYGEKLSTTALFNGEFKFSLPMVTY